MALCAAGVNYELREVLLKDKPESMLAASNKGTVPVLVLADRVIDESLDVMAWVLELNDPLGLDVLSLGQELVRLNDQEFKPILDRYKYFERFPEQPQSVYLEQAKPFLQRLEDALGRSSVAFLTGAKASATDLAIFPFIRQFASADSQLFEQLPLPRLKHWLREWMASDLFKQVMDKYPVWEDGAPGIEIQPLPVIHHVPDEHQWIVPFDDGQHAYLRYRLEANQSVDLYTTVVPENQRGGGVAARLVDTVLDWAQREQLTIHASCWYAEKRLNKRAA